MKHIEYGWRAEDGINIHARRWEPDSGPKGVVCLVHGFGEHSGRYHHVASYLTGAGYAVASFDHRGHGKSGGQRGHTTSYQAIMEDIDLLLDDAGHRYPGLPCFIYGHSMGGNLALNYTLRRKPPLLGVIATSPWLRLSASPPAALLAAARVLNKLAPSYPLPNSLDAKGLSHDPEVVRAYDSDPLVNRKITTRLFFSIHDAGLWALDHASEFHLPLLLMHGGTDPITSPEASSQFAGRIPGRCTLKIWEGLYHELHNEPQKGEIIGFIVNWLDGHLG
ncbi:MAG: alpha/beta hydrolase [Bacillota bacterium]